MGDIRDQLLKAGLVTEEQVRDAREPAKKRRGTAPAGKKGKPARRKPGKPSRPAASGGRDPGNVDLAEAYRLRAREERRAREQAERERREAERQRKANRARIAELIREHSQNDDTADQPYHFSVGDKVKQVQVTRDQLKALAGGELAITFLEGRRHLIPAAIADQIHALDPGKLVIRHERDAPDRAEDDIPDDLMW